MWLFERQASHIQEISFFLQIRHIQIRGLFTTEALLGFKYIDTNQMETDVD